MSSNAVCYITEGGETPRRKREETPGVGAAKDVHWKQKGETLLTSHQDHIADRRYLSMCHYGMVHTSIRLPKAMKIPAPRAAEDRELSSLPAWSEAKVRAKADVIHEAQNKKDFIALHSKRHIKAESCFEETMSKTTQDAKHSSPKQGASASQTAVTVLDTISRLLGRAREANDAVSACTQVNMEVAPRLLKLLETECFTICVSLPGSSSSSTGQDR